jgi:hypothetical protein
MRHRELSIIKQKVPERVFRSLDAFVHKKINIKQRRYTRRIEALRNELKTSQRVLKGIKPKGGYSPGKDVEFIPSQGTLGDVIKRASKRPIWCRMLYTLNDKFRPKHVLELGTCVGISTAYLAAALEKNKMGKLFTLEGSEDFSEVAEANLTRLGLSGRVTFIRGLFDDTLETVLKKSESWDYVFIDGHHDGDATWRYLLKIYPRLAEVALVILDDIRWSDDMLRVWVEITTSELFQLCVDFSEIGLCYKFPSKDNYRINISVT